MQTVHNQGTHLVVQEGLQQRLSSSCRPTRLSLVRPDWIKRIDCSFTIFVDATQDIVHVVREEAFTVEHIRNHSCNGAQAHLGTSVVVAVEDHLLLDAVDKGLCISREAIAGQTCLVVEAKHFGLVSRLNVVTRGLTGVSSYDAEVLSGDGEDGATCESGEEVASSKHQ